jgi:hypothetical protein
MRGIHEVHGAEDVAVVGHGHGRHPQFFDSLAEFLDVTGAVEHGVVGMQVQVDELRHELPRKLESYVHFNEALGTRNAGK